MADSSFITIWLVGGIALMLLELFLPGGVAFFLGLGATIVALLLLLGVIHNPLQAFTTWFIGSLALLFGLRGVVQWFCPSAVEKSSTNEDADAYDQIVEVAETIPKEGEGRIHFRGTTWRARNYQGDQDLPRESRVRLIFRDNLVWVVEGVEAEASDNQGR